MIRVEFTGEDSADVRQDGVIGVMSCVRGEDGYWKPMAFDFDGDKREMPDDSKLSAEIQDAILYAEMPR